MFASEIKALFATGEVAPKLAHDDLLELLMFHFIAGEQPRFDVVELLPRAPASDHQSRPELDRPLLVAAGFRAPATHYR